jgi:hypothetical protein
VQAPFAGQSPAELEEEGRSRRLAIDKLEAQVVQMKVGEENVAEELAGRAQRQNMPSSGVQYATVARVFAKTQYVMRQVACAGESSRMLARNAPRLPLPLRRGGAVAGTTTADLELVSRLGAVPRLGPHVVSITSTTATVHIKGCPSIVLSAAVTAATLPGVLASLQQMQRCSGLPPRTPFVAESVTREYTAPSGIARPGVFSLQCSHLCKCVGQAR